MKLSAISILQPWAGFILSGSKRVENRTWQTRHRGPLLIHAGQNRRMLERTVPDHWFDLAGIIRHDALNRGEFKTGAVLGIVNVVDVRLAEGRQPTSWHDPPTPGRKSYWWELSGAVLFDKPIEHQGRLMLFDVELPDDTVLWNDQWPTLRDYMEKFRR